MWVADGLQEVWVGAIAADPAQRPEGAVSLDVLWNELDGIVIFAARRPYDLDAVLKKIREVAGRAGVAWVADGPGPLVVRQGAGAVTAELAAGVAAKVGKGGLKREGDRVTLLGTVSLVLNGTPVAIGSGLTLSVFGEAAGQLHDVNGTLPEALTKALGACWSVNDAVVATPMFTGGSPSFTGVVDLASPCQSARTRLELNDARALPSAWTTTFGNPVSLAPRPHEAGVLLVPRPDGVQLVPDGLFDLQVESGTLDGAAAPVELVMGISATETVQGPPHAIAMRFSLGPAHVDRGSQTLVARMWTAWLQLEGATDYRLHAQGSPFYLEGGEVLPPAWLPLGAPTEPAPSAPWTAAATREQRAAIEPILVRERASRWTTPPAERAAIDSWVTMPHGLRALVSTAVDTLVLASRDGHALTLKPLDPRVTASLEQTEAIWVASRDSVDGVPLFKVGGDLVLEEWTFQHAPLTDGRVLVLKLGPGTLRELLADPTCWSAPSQLNADPSSLSTSLLATLGAEDASIQRLLDDPAWRGALWVGLPVVPPAFLQAVLYGIAPPTLTAQVVAVGITDVRDPVLADAVSAPLARVRFDGSSELISRDSFTYAVPELLADFDQGLLGRFSCRLQLGVTQWFGVPVVLVGQPDGRIELQGQYQRTGDGTGTFLFQNADVHRFEADYSQLTASLPGWRIFERFEVHRLRFWVLSAGLSAFGFDGNLRFGATPGIDLFDFDALPITNLQVRKHDEDPVRFGFYTGDIGVPVPPTPRAGLYEGFPLELTALEYTPGTSLAGRGYLPVVMPPGSPVDSDVVDTMLHYRLFLGHPGADWEGPGYEAVVTVGFTPDCQISVGFKLSQAEQDHVLRIARFFDVSFERVALSRLGGDGRFVLGLSRARFALFGQSNPTPPSFTVVRLIAPDGRAGPLVWFGVDDFRGDAACG